MHSDANRSTHFQPGYQRIKTHPIPHNSHPQNAMRKKQQKKTAVAEKAIPRTMGEERKKRKERNEKRAAETLVQHCQHILFCSTALPPSPTAPTTATPNPPGQRTVSLPLPAAHRPSAVEKNVTSRTWPGDGLCRFQPARLSCTWDKPSQYCQETLFSFTPFRPGCTSAERSCAGPPPAGSGTVSVLPCSTSCTWDELCRCSK